MLVEASVVFILSSFKCNSLILCVIFWTTKKWNLYTCTCVCILLQIHIFFENDLPIYLFLIVRTHTVKYGTKIENSSLWWIHILKGCQVKTIFSLHGWWEAPLNHHTQIRNMNPSGTANSLFLTSSKTQTFGRQLPCVRHNNRDGGTYKQVSGVNSHIHYPKSQWTHKHSATNLEMPFARAWECT